METNPVKAGLLTENSAGVGTVSRKMVRDRAIEFAVIDGRSPNEVSKLDWEQAKRELTGAPAADQQELALESAPEAARWDPVPGFTGQMAPVTGSEDEDEEGQSDQTRLTQEGMAGAEHDLLRQSARAANQPAA